MAIKLSRKQAYRPSPRPPSHFAGGGGAGGGGSKNLRGLAYLPRLKLDKMLNIALTCLLSFLTMKPYLNAILINSPAGVSKNVFCGLDIKLTYVHSISPLFVISFSILNFFISYREVDLEP